MYTKTVGTATMIDIAASTFWSVKNAPWKLLSAAVIGRRSPVFNNSRPQKKSL